MEGMTAPRLETLSSELEHAIEQLRETAKSKSVAPATRALLRELLGDAVQLKGAALNARAKLEDASRCEREIENCCERLRDLNAAALEDLQRRLGNESDRQESFYASSAEAGDAPRPEPSCGPSDCTASSAADASGETAEAAAASSPERHPIQQGENPKTPSLPACAISQRTRVFLEHRDAGEMDSLTNAQAPLSPSGGAAAGASVRLPFGEADPNRISRAERSPSDPPTPQIQGLKATKARTARYGRGSNGSSGTGDPSGTPEPLWHSPPKTPAFRVLLDDGDYGRSSDASGRECGSASCEKPRAHSPHAPAKNQSKSEEAANGSWLSGGGGVAAFGASSLSATPSPVPASGAETHHLLMTPPNSQGLGFGSSDDASCGARGCVSGSESGSGSQCAAEEAQRTPELPSPPRAAPPVMSVEEFRRRPVSVVSEREYAGAPKFLTLQVSRNELNAAVECLNDGVAAGGPLELSQEEADAVVLLIGGSRARALLLSLQHLKRLEVHKKATGDTFRILRG